MFLEQCDHFGHTPLVTSVSCRIGWGVNESCGVRVCAIWGYAATGMDTNRCPRIRISLLSFLRF